MLQPRTAGMSQGSSSSTFKVQSREAFLSVVVVNSAVLLVGLLRLAPVAAGWAGGLAFFINESMPVPNTALPNGPLAA